MNTQTALPVSANKPVTLDSGVNADFRLALDYGLRDEFLSAEFKKAKRESLAGLLSRAAVDAEFEARAHWADFVSRSA
jgi:hypothetical protein